MSVTATYDAGLNQVHTLNQAIARQVKFSVGSLAVTYSAAGGLTWTLPFSDIAFVMIPPASQYIFTYNATSNMLQAWQCQVTTTASASVLVEAASDTDFTALAMPLQFVAFGW